MPKGVYPRVRKEPSWVAAEARFRRMVPALGSDECWVWQGSIHVTGYGHFRFGGKLVKAHRVAFFLHNGRWPEPCCCHTCDNPACCNPAHLFEGTSEANTADRHNKGRSVRGSRQGLAKLTEEDIPIIRALVAWSGFSHGEVAAEFGVHKSNISHVMRGKVWAHV